MSAHARGAKDRFAWERAIIGTNGPASATTRLVLLVLATHVPRGQALAWPSVRTLEAETALSNRAVIDHLDAAMAGGWLRVETAKLPRMQRRGRVYHLTIPGSVEASSPNEAAVSGERGSAISGSYQHPPRNGEGGDQSGERGAGESVNVVPRTSMISRKDQEKLEQGGGENGADRTSKQPEQGDWRLWATERGLQQRPGEDNIAYMLRIVNARREERLHQATG